MPDLENSKPKPLPVTNPYWKHLSILSSTVELSTRYVSGDIRTRWVSQPTCLISGLGITDPSGKLDIQFEHLPLAKFYREHVASDISAVIIDPEIAFTVSPRSVYPVFLTYAMKTTRKSFDGFYTFDLITGSTGQPHQCYYQIDLCVYSWNPDSTPAENIHFGWNCLVEAVGFALGER